MQQCDSNSSEGVSVPAMSKFQLAKRFQGLAQNVWVEYSALAVKHKALNLGQGFTDYAAPKHVTDALASVANSDNPLLHQYARGFGHVRLVNALAKLYTGVFDRNVDAMKNILVSGGAYMSLFTAISGMAETGDEVIIVEPFFDCYDPMVRSSGAKSVFVPLRPKVQSSGRMSSSDWVFDEEELTNAFSSKTKLIIINTPNNPIGKVYSKSELELVASLCKKHDVVCISDEVYEWLVYPGVQSCRIATLPGMWDRTITIGSAGKTFSVTGWKMGWTIGPEHLLTMMQTVHQNACYTCATPLQEALAIAFEKELERLNSPECYFNSISAELLPKRDRLVQILEEVGLPVYLPEGGYFLLCDISKLPPLPDVDSCLAKDEQLVRWLTSHKQLATIPCSVFYGSQNKTLGEKYIRFCFFKKDETIEAAGKILRSWLC